MSFNLVTKIPVPSDEEKRAIIARNAQRTADIVTSLTDEVTNKPPTEWTCGVIIGFLRSQGCSWKECFVMMNEYMNYTIEAQKRKELGKTLEKRHSFRLEMITCSVGCADFLRKTLPLNRVHFDNVIVVTDSKDEETKRVAQEYGATIFETDIFYANGNRFDRGTAYNDSLVATRFKDWVSFVDVDIVLPKDFRVQLSSFGLVDDCFYGLDRQEVTGDEREKLYKNEPFVSSKREASDWGFGFFQLFNMQSRFIKGKNIIYPGAEDIHNSDYLFRSQFGSGHSFNPDTGLWKWDPIYQIELPFFCYHVGNKDGASLTRHYPNPHGPPLSEPPQPISV